MQNVIYAATVFGYCVQVIDGGKSSTNTPLETAGMSLGRHRPEIAWGCQAVPNQTLGRPNSKGNRQRAGHPFESNRIRS